LSIIREDPRVTRSKACVLATTLETLRSDGMSGVTIERIAAASGVAKTTIYRHWDGRGELVFDALESLMEHSPYAASTSLRADLLVGLGHLAAGLESSVWAEVMPSMIAAAEHDEHILELAREFAARRRAGLEERLQLAVDAGDIDARTNVSLLTSELVGPLFYRRFISRQPITEALVEEHVDRLLVSVDPADRSV
jgi:AcrR family transcriptional regulator